VWSERLASGRAVVLGHWDGDFVVRALLGLLEQAREARAPEHLQSELRRVALADVVDDVDVEVRVGPGSVTKVMAAPSIALFPDSGAGPSSSGSSSDTRCSFRYSGSRRHAPSERRPRWPQGQEDGKVGAGGHGHLGSRGKVRNGQPTPIGLEEANVDPEAERRTGEAEFDHPSTASWPHGAGGPSSRAPRSIHAGSGFPETVRAMRDG